MYELIEYEGCEIKVMSSKQAATRLACGLSTIRKYLGQGLLKGTQIYDPKSNRMRQYIFVESVYKFTPPPLGRGKGNQDRTTDRSKRKKAAQENGRLGGLANRGVPRRRSSATKKLRNLT